MEPKASASGETVMNEQDWEVRNDGGFVFLSPKRRRVDPAADPPDQAPPSSSLADLQRGATVMNKENWEVLNDTSFIFTRSKRQQVDPAAYPPPQAPPSSSAADLPEEGESNLLQNQYQTEINQWVILSSALRACVRVACDKLERLRAESAASGNTGSDELQGSNSDRKSLIAMVHSMMPLLTEANSQATSQPVPPSTRNAPTEPQATSGTLPSSTGLRPQTPALPMSSAAMMPQSDEDTKPRRRRRVSKRLQAKREIIPVELGSAKRSAKSPKYLEDFVPK